MRRREILHPNFHDATMVVRRRHPYRHIRVLAIHACRLLMQCTPAAVVGANLDYRPTIAIITPHNERRWSARCVTYCAQIPRRDVPLKHCPKCRLIVIYMFVCILTVSLSVASVFLQRSSYRSNGRQQQQLTPVYVEHDHRLYNSRSPLFPFSSRSPSLILLLCVCLFPS
jgi:hypothetical protein